MKKLFKMILVNALSLWIIDVLFISIHFTDTTTLIVTAAVLGFLNSTLKPFLKVISLPLNILSLGLFSLLINGLVFSLALNIGGGYVSNLQLSLQLFYRLQIVDLIHFWTINSNEDIGYLFFKRERFKANCRISW